MARGNTVDIIDFKNEPYEPSEFKEKIALKYPGITEFNHIYLHRYNSKGECPTLRKYPELPDEEAIRLEWGGGQYELWISFTDESTKTGRNLVKVPIMIAGDPIEPVYNKPADAPQQLPAPEGDIEDKMLDRMAKYKLLFGSQDSTSSTQLILKSMEANNKLIVEMIQAGAKNNNSDLTNTLLAKALEKNTGDLDLLLKYKDIFGSGSESEWGWLKDMAPSLIPVVLAMLQKNNAGAALNGSTGAPAGQLPPGQHNPMAALLQAIKQAVKEEVEPLKKELAEIKSGIEPIPDDELELEDPQGDENPEPLRIVNQDPNTNGTVNELNNPNNMAYMETIAAALIKATDEEKISTLRNFVNSYGEKSVYDWCIKWKVVKDISEFNDWMKKAGLPEHSE
jgi:hypothetical protein